MTLAIRPRSWFAVFTSGHFFTRWTWLLTAPFAVTLLGGHDAATTTAQRVSGVGVAAVVHLLCGLVGLIGARIERIVPSHRARAVAVVLVLLLIGTMRPLAIARLTQLSGSPAFPVPMGARVVTNLVAALVATTLIAVLVDALARRRRTVTQLDTVAWWLETERTHGRRLVAESARVIEETQRLLNLRLTDLERSWAAATLSARAAALRRYSTSVVRPGSHRLAELRTSDALERTLASEQRPHRPPVGRTTRLLPAPVGLPITLYVAVLSPFALARLPLSTTLLAAAVAWATGVLCEALLSRWASRVRSRDRSAAVVVCGIVATAAAILATSAPVVGDAAIPAAAVVYTALALMCAAVASYESELRSQADTLSDRTRAYRIDEQDGRGQTERRLTDAAQLLHGELQSICLVAAARIERETCSGAWETALADARRVIAALDTPRDVAVPGSEDTVRAVLDGWGRVITIRFLADPPGWHVIDQHAELLQRLVDAVSEALTNILRHGTERVATIALTVAGDRVRLTVDTPGRIAPPSGPGIGLSTLRERADSVELTQQDASVRLEVCFVTSVTAQS